MRLLLFIFFIFLSGVIASQDSPYPVDQSWGSANTMNFAKGAIGSKDGFWFIQYYTDTAAANDFTPAIRNISGFLIRVGSSGDQLWIRNETATAWVQIGSGSISAADNGLTLSGNTVKLGGTLTDATTTVLMNSKNLDFSYDGTDYFRWRTALGQRNFGWSINRAVTTEDYLNQGLNNGTNSTVTLRFLDNDVIQTTSSLVQLINNGGDGTGQGGYTLEGYSEDGARAGIDGDAFGGGAKNTNSTIYAYQTGYYNMLRQDSSGTYLTTGTESGNAKGLLFGKDKSVTWDTAYVETDTTGSKVAIRKDSDSKVYWVNAGSFSGGSSDHGALTGLSDDDHTQYALLTGRSGGQTLIGGTDAADDLTLQASSNAGAAGDIVFKVGNSGATTALIMDGPTGNLFPGVDGTTAIGQHTGGHYFAGVYGNSFYANGTGRLYAANVEKVSWASASFTINDNSSDVDVRIESDGDANNFFSDGGTNRIGIGTNAPTEKLHVSGSGQIRVDAMAAASSPDTTLTIEDGVIKTGSIVTSGSYTPTLTGVLNVASTGTTLMYYTRIGSTVSYTIYMSVTPTAATTTTSVRFSLPVSSAFTTSGDLFGTGVGTITGNSVGGIALADATNDEGGFSFESLSTAAHTIVVSGHYTIK